MPPVDRSRHTRRTGRRLRAAIVASLLLGTTLTAGCGADPGLQHDEAAVLARTCASLRQRQGDDPAPTPPDSFITDFLRRTPDDAHGPMTKNELDRRCGTASPAETGTTSPTTSTPTRGARMRTG